MMNAGVTALRIEIRNQFENFVSDRSVYARAWAWEDSHPYLEFVLYDCCLFIGTSQMFDSNLIHFHNLLWPQRHTRLRSLTKSHQIQFDKLKPVKSWPDPPPTPIQTKLLYWKYQICCQLSRIWIQQRIKLTFDPFELLMSFELDILFARMRASHATSTMSVHPRLDPNVNSNMHFHLLLMMPG